MNETDRKLWEAVLVADQALLSQNWAFLQGANDPATVIANSLVMQGETGAALRYLLVAAPDTIKMATLPQVLFLALGSNGYTPLARDIIVSILPRKPLLEALEPLADKLLSDSDDESYLRLAELYAQLDDQLLAKHLDRCRQHPNPMVQEVLTYFVD